MNALILTDRDRDRDQFYDRCQQSFLKYKVITQYCPYQENEIKRMLETMQPDILLMDAANRGPSVKSVFGYINSVPLAVKPGVFVRLKRRDNEQESHFLNLGAMYVFDERFGDEELPYYIHNTYRLHRKHGGEENVEDFVHTMLTRCCLSHKHLGFGAIFNAVMHAYRNEQDRVLTRAIYPDVAKENNSSIIRVEKNIRDAIRNAWNNGGADVIPGLLGVNPNRAPTNSQFIMGIVERVHEFVHLGGITID